MRRTVDEIAAELSIERPAADGLVRFLLANKLAEFKGERPSQRGKGAHVYTIKDGAGEAVAAKIRKLEG